MSRELFQNYYELIPHNPQRPLGEVSDFVVQHMPGVLAHIRSGELPVQRLVQHANDLVSGLSPEVMNSFPEPRTSSGFGDWVSTHPPLMIAHLDATMLEAGIVHSGGIPPKSLTQLVDRLSGMTNQLPVITYEGIAYANPQNDVRTFTGDEQGRPHPIEADFYRGHPLIDQGFENAALNMRSAISAISDPELRVKLSRGPKEMLEEACNDLVKANALMVAYKSPHLTESFRTFRLYLGSHPTRHLKGPSGAFSASVPLVDILLAGRSLPTPMIEYLTRNLMYFPRQGRRELTQALQESAEGKTLFDIVSPAHELHDLTEEIKEQVRIFRSFHRGAVQTQLQDVLIGTAGEPIAEFLGARQRLYGK